jgi:NADH-quinone oxidoreductase subunit H
MTYLVLEALIKIGILIGGVMTAVAYLVLLERRVAAWVQDRHGPNRVGIPLTNLKLAGLGQPLADGLKFLFKEEYTPGHVDRVAYFLAPILIMASALVAMAVVPFGAVSIPWGDKRVVIDMVVAPGLDVGLVFMFAMSGLAVYGVIVGGWASNSKYSFLGGLRASAQLISYEIPLGLGIIGVVLVAGSLRLDDIILSQSHGLGWNAFAQPLGMLVFFVAALAEAARLPFDLPECEQELVGGYHTEYSGMKLACFLSAEFIHMITAAFLLVILFLGGWHFWGITGGPEETVGPVIAAIRIGVMLVKVLLVIVLIMLIRWSWPRFRFDQLMDRAWKVMLPLGLVNLIVVATLVEFAPHARLVHIIVGWGTLVAGLVVTAMASAGTTARGKVPTSADAPALAKSR